LRDIQATGGAADAAFHSDDVESAQMLMIYAHWPKFPDADRPKVFPITFMSTHL
jgi:hypothetical protein